MAKNKPKEIEIEIEMPLTEIQLNETARKHVDLTAEHDKLVDQFKDNRQKWRDDIKAKRIERDETGKTVIRRSEKQKILCTENINMQTKKRELLDKDGKVVREFDLSTEEIEKHGTKPMFDTPENNVADVMREEKDPKTKVDHVAGVN